MTDQLFTIRSRKLDGTLAKSWSARLLDRSEDLLLLQGQFDSEINHEHLGVIRRGTFSREYYWLDRWYCVFAFYEPGGGFRNFYLNVNTPPLVGSDVLEYIDLDIDVIVWPDHSFEVLDLEEFERNSVRMGYDIEIRKKARDALDRIIALIGDRGFPLERTHGLKKAE